MKTWRIMATDGSTVKGPFLKRFPPESQVRTYSVACTYLHERCEPFPCERLEYAERYFIRSHEGDFLMEMF